MRWFLIMMALAGCELAPAEPALSPLVTVNIEVLESEADVGPFDALVTWYLLENSGVDRTAWMTTERHPFAGSVPITRPPPLEAFFGEDQEIAVGFVSLVDRSAGSTFDWADPFDFDPLPTVAGTEQTVIVYLDSTRPYSPEWDLTGGSLQPGFNLVDVSEEDDPRYALRSAEAAVEVLYTPEWFPGVEACGQEVQPVPIPLAFEDEGFEEVVTNAGECADCGATFVTLSCDVFLGELCEECFTLQLTYDSRLGDEWPCIPVWECEAQEELCVLDQLYRCTAGRYRRVEDCSAGADCCESGCTQVP
ncbi:MAG: hypothetical protein AAFU77_03950 [Myxococcota bacterium]